MLRQLGFYRLLIMAVLLALLWGVLTWLASGSREASILAASFSLILAPILVAPFYWYGLRLRGRLVKADMLKEITLRNLVLKCLLVKNPLQLEIWVLNEDLDEGFFWYEKMGFRKTKSLTRFVVTRAWLNHLESNPSSIEGEFENIWDKVSSYSVYQRRLRSLQIRFWTGGFLILELLLKLLDKVMSFLGVKRMPPAAFWCQGWAWQLAAIGFGLSVNSNQVMKISQHALRVDVEPLYWKSFLWGVWSLYPSRVLHPAWRFLTREEALT